MSLQMVSNYPQIDNEALKFYAKHTSRVGIIKQCSRFFTETLPGTHIFFNFPAPLIWLSRFQNRHPSLDGEKPSASYAPGFELTWKRTRRVSSPWLIQNDRIINGPLSKLQDLNYKPGLKMDGLRDVLTASFIQKTNCRSFWNFLVQVFLWFWVTSFDHPRVASS